ncbi:AAA+ ATPase domain-containing protein [Artemisia annua]|uniref:AAA+ ATPase domain-containing protein n=1 Tax=Artemisia annua TaxID=35608 RepID=A0A2U1KS98_ARTAN|nr:AAA+ ATPase domain-containing protein [Artemisia annua]
MASRLFPVMPTTSLLLSAYASLSTSFVLFQTVFNQLVPPQLRGYIIDVVKCYWKHKTSDQLTILFEERDRRNPNDMFYAVEVFLSTKITADSKCLKITKSMNDEHFKIKLAESEKIVDSFEGVTVTWKYHSQQQNQRSASSDDKQEEKNYMELKFDKNYKDIIISSYLPFIIKKAQEIKNQKKVVKLHDGRRRGVNLDHPSTFETLAIDPKKKKEIMEDLDLFLNRRDFYKKIRKAWKRGYLLYGPPRQENRLMHVHDDESLRDILLETSNRSILVIEDIDCSILPDRKGAASFNGSHLDYSKVSSYFHLLGIALHDLT